MKKSHTKLLIFDIILIIFFLLNSFILSILTYINLAILLLGLIILFKIIFGLEKDNHRYIKDVIINILIVLLTSFLIYYIIGIVIGFVKTSNYYNLNSLKDFIIPYIIIIVLREYLRYQILQKSGKSKLLIVMSVVVFILISITTRVTINDFDSKYNAFIFLATILLPAITRNIACTYIAKKVGFKPNILWILVIELYGVLLPFVPDMGLYIGSMISLLYPTLIIYNVYRFFERRKNNVPLQDDNRRNYITIPFLVLFIGIIVYFTSGYFRYYTIAIATGSMTPNILKGDVVVIDQEYPKDNLEVGQVIAYRYNSVIIVNRLVNIIEIKDEKYYYTKGDANNAVDNYIIYEDMIMGVVDYKIPYVGLPTVWLNEL